MLRTHNDGGGNFVFRPRIAQVEQLIELILGKASSSSWIPINNDATDLPTFTLEVTKAGQDQIALLGSKVDVATLKSQANGPLEVDLKTIAMSGVRNSGSFTTWAPTQMDATAPLMHSGLVFSNAETFFGGNVECRSIELVLNNNLDAEGYCNSTDRRIIPLGLFTLEGSIEIPYNSTTKGFWTTQCAAGKVKFTASWASGTTSLTAAIVCKLDGELPKVSSPETQWIKLAFHGVMDATDPNCITLTCDAT